MSSTRARKAALNITAIVKNVSEHIKGISTTKKIAAKSETGEGMDIDRLRLALARFTSTELLAELKTQGYEWEKMYEPRKEVLFENV